MTLLRESFPHITAHNLHHNATSTAEIAVALLLAASKLIVLADRYVYNSNNDQQQVQHSKGD